MSNSREITLPFKIPKLLRKIPGRDVLFITEHYAKGRRIRVGPAQKMQMEDGKTRLVCPVLNSHLTRNFVFADDLKSQEGTPPFSMA